jgi:hypothetical protein
LNAQVWPNPRPDDSRTTGGGAARVGISSSVITEVAGYDRRIRSERREAQEEAAIRLYARHALERTGLTRDAGGGYPGGDNAGGHQAAQFPAPEAERFFQLTLDDLVGSRLSGLPVGKL